MSTVNFPINDNGPVSKAFLERDLHTFEAAANYIQQFTYHRNKDKTDLLSVFTDKCGTCSTKHALLKLLIDEQGQPGFRLVMGIYKMSGANTRGVAPVLERYHMEYMPEAHNYLKCNGEILDYTRKGSKGADFANDLLEETEILPSQITDYKVSYHKQFLSKWLVTANLPYNETEIWNIREACIAAL